MSGAEVPALLAASSAASGAAAAGGAAAATTISTGTLLKGALAIGSAGLGAIQSMQQGAAMSAMYGQMAQQTLSQARSQVLASRQKALQYRQQGLKVLDEMRKTASTINARGAAGSLNPFSGSLDKIMTVSFDQGYQDFSIAKDNRLIEQDNMIIIQKSAERQAAIYRAAARQSRRQGMFGALTSVATSALSYGASAGFGGFGAAAMPAGSITGVPTMGGSYPYGVV